ncbi:hypothetical protein P171DRAFT_362174, partial [Karstenula rhodostoma CBS 690.94]
FKRNKISLYPYPPYSLDLNPIENIWAILKDRLNKRPRGSLGYRTSSESIGLYIRAIKEE